MPHPRRHTHKKTPKRVLALPDLERGKSAVLSTLSVDDAGDCLGVSRSTLKHLRRQVQQSPSA
jgi:hypothetical protein